MHFTRFRRFARFGKRPDIAPRAKQVLHMPRSSSLIGSARSDGSCIPGILNRARWRWTGRLRRDGGTHDERGIPGNSKSLDETAWHAERAAEQPGRLSIRPQADE